MSTVCIGNGRIAHLLGRGCTKAVAVWYLRPWSHRISGFDTLSLALHGSHNDINVLQRSPLFVRLTGRKAPPCHYSVSGHEYNMGYFDGIYPSWAIFVNTISNLVGQKKSHFAKRQEATRNDVERAFGVLQACFAIVRGPTKQWDRRPCRR